MAMRGEASGSSWLEGGIVAVEWSVCWFEVCGRTPLKELLSVFHGDPLPGVGTSKWSGVSYRVVLYRCARPKSSLFMKSLLKMELPCSVLDDSI